MQTNCGLLIYIYIYKGEHLETVWGFPYLVYTLVIEHSQSLKLTASFTEQSPVCLSPEQMAPAVPPGSTDAAGLCGMQ